LRTITDSVRDTGAIILVPMLEHNGQIVRGEGFIIDDFTNHGLDFMEQNQDKPFLLYLPFNTPHTPFQAPQEYWDRYKEKDIEMLAEHEGENLEHTRAALAMCENIDWNVGRIVAKTRELGIEENTIILYFSDNGPNSWRWNGGMKGRKGSVDEGGVRSPLFIKWPAGIEAGKQIDRLMSVTDLLPTLSEMCGIPCETNHPLDGISVKESLLEDEDTNGRTAIF
jgi:arylsulfatase A-like enzyme